MVRRTIEGRLHRLILISFTHYLDPDRVERKERRELPTITAITMVITALGNRAHPQIK